ncbi:MAG TPA: MCP four helix bundle domain-containing protein, partial [Herbaspirillum sp.]
MKWFYNLKIAKKLTLAFVMVLILTAVLGVFSIIQITKVNQASTEISVNWLPALASINNMKMSLARTRSGEFKHIALSDGTDASGKEKVSPTEAKEFEKLLQQYQTQISEPGERAIFPELKKNIDAFMAVHNQLTELVITGKLDEARLLAKGESTKIYNQISKQLDALAKINKDGSVQSDANAEATLAMARGWIIALLAGSLIVGLSLAVFVARIISNPLNQAVVVAKRVADGDLTAQIEAASEDETGQLMHSLKAMNDNLLRIVGEVRIGTDTIATASSEIASGNLDLSSRTEQQASSLEETASAMEQLTATVKQNSDNAKQANQL